MENLSLAVILNAAIGLAVLAWTIRDIRREVQRNRAQRLRREGQQ